MKKLLVITSLTAAGVMGAMAQGTINPNPGGSTTVFVTVSDSSTTSPINNGTPVTIGTPAVTAGFADVGKSSVNISLYAAVSGTSLATLEASTPLITVLNSGSALASFQGTFSITSPYTVTTAAVPGWNGSAPLEFIYFGQTTDGKYSGWSGEATGITVATGTGLAPSIFGTTPGLINSFNITNPVPEPSTIVLGGLGAAALLAFRRRK